jgi:hypothetical protein
LYRNRDALSGAGVYLSDVLQKPNNRDFVAFFQDNLGAFAAIKKIGSPDERRDFFEGFLESLADEIRAAAKSHHSMIITSEHFHSRTTKASEIRRIREFLEPLFDEIRIVCYLREQSAVRKSLYSTTLRFDGDRDVEEFQDKVAGKSHYYNYAVFLSKWEEEFGREQLSPRVYDRAGFVDGDLRKDFILTVMPDIDLAGLDFEEETVNESLSYLQAVAFRAINKRIPYFVEGGGVSAVNVLFKDIVLKVGHLDQGKIIDSRQQGFAELFRDSNRELAERYFEGRELFPEPPASQQDYYTEKRYSLAELAGVVDGLVTRFAGRLAGRLLSAADVDAIRDAALSVDREEPLTREEAAQLLEIAARARPVGTVIKQKLKQLKKHLGT